MMKKKSTPALLFILCIFSFTSYAQDLTGESIEEGGEYRIGRNDANSPCITPEQYKSIEKQNIDNCKMLGLHYDMNKSLMTTSFIWPLRMANGLNDCSYYFIGNYVDEDTTAGLKDWNCGAVTYNGHRGDDIGTFPYPFYKMDHNQVEVIAAAGGTIINKADGNFDKNCSVNNLNPNYLAIQHADGSIAIYYHLKLNSVTSKVVGQTVVTGEYLGVVGSSGSSTGPHLHFEVWANNNSSSVNEAYAGTCNLLNANSWWAVQKPYTEPAIVAATVNTTNPFLPACPATETPNEDSCFTSSGSAKFVIFIRNETTGLIVKMRIVNPNGTTFSSWTHNSNNTYNASYWIATRTLPTTSGTYTFEAVYNGDTCSKSFKINCNVNGVTTINDLSQIEVYPNPSRGVFKIIGSGIENGNYRFTLRNIIGQSILEDNIKIVTNNFQKNISISELSNDIYFLTIETEKTKTVKKIIIQNQ